MLIVTLELPKGKYLDYFFITKLVSKEKSKKRKKEKRLKILKVTQEFLRASKCSPDKLKAVCV